jgi:hypothetical protein
VKETQTKYKNDAICNIWVLMVIKIITITKIKVINWKWWWW